MGTLRLNTCQFITNTGTLHSNSGDFALDVENAFINYMLKLSNDVSFLKTIKLNYFALLQFKFLVQRHISQREKKLTWENIFNMLMSHNNLLSINFRNIQIRFDLRLSAHIQVTW